MAAVVGTINRVTWIDDSYGPVVDSSGNLIRTALITVSFTGTYAQANDGTVAGVPAAIQGIAHNGKTVTVLGACAGPPGLAGAGGIVPMGVLANGVSHSAGTLTVQLSDGTLAAEYADATAIGTFTRDVGIIVTVKLS